MPVRLTSGTDVATHLLYDPRAMAHRINAPHDSWFDKIEEDAQHANVLAYFSGADGTAELAIYVDEEPPADLVARARPKQTGHLKVPSGRLLATGMEYLTPEHLSAPDPAGLLDLPVGGYDVEAFTVARLEETAEAKAEADRLEQAAALAEPQGHRLSRARWALFRFTLLPLLTAIALFLIVVALAKGVFLDFLGTRLAYGLVVIAIEWIVFLAIGRIAAVRRYEQMSERDAEPDDAPDCVIVLRRRTEPPEIWQGVSLSE